MKVSFTIEFDQEPGRPDIYRLVGAKELPLGVIHQILTAVATDVMVKMTANTVFDILKENANKQRVVLAGKMP